MVDWKIIARRLRSQPTSAETRLWAGLRKHAVEGFRFRRQVRLLEFIVDFACHDAKLAVEVDGATHSTDEEVARDRERDRRVWADGWEVVRVTNDEVFYNLEGVLETIRLKLLELKPR